MVHVLTYDKVNKVITVPTSYGTEITIQNLLNDIRDFEDELTSLDIPKIASCAGKEDLGGGVSVGLTLTLLDDWRLAFEERTGPTWVQCSVSGGNLVAVNTNGSIYPTAYVTVTITASSSATTADLDAIQYSSYNGGVSIDVTATHDYATGTTYPTGNQEYPVNNLTDAVTIANSKGFKTLFIRESMTISSGTIISDFILKGNSRVLTVVTIDSSVICDGIRIERCNISGTLDGGTRIQDCSVGTVNYVNGQIRDSGLYGTITLDGNEEAVIANCYTIDQDNQVIVDMGSSGQDLAMPNYSGLVTIQNLTSATEEIGIGLNAGMVILESSITSGTIIVSGIGMVSDNTIGTTIVDTSTLISTTTIADAVWEEILAEHLDAGSTGKALSDAGSSGNPWSTPISGNTTAGTFGELVGKKLLTLAKWLGLK